jgi:cytoskeletal protein RodZ
MAAFGDTLHSARAQRGLSLIEAAQQTYISRFYLDALEKENFNALPDGSTFRRGIVRHYASYLGLDPAVILKLYEEASGDRAIEPVINQGLPPGVNNGLGYLNFSMIGVVLILFLVGFAWVYSVYFGDSTRPETPTQIIATLTPMDPSALNIPSPTPKPPTPTPVPPTPTPLPPTPTSEPEPTREQQEAPPPANTEADDTDINDEPINYEVTSEDPDPGVRASVKIEAIGYICVTVVVDGAAAFDGCLNPGESTRFFNGTLLTVYTSDDSLTYYYSATTPGGFIMGGSGPVTYEFP